VTGIVVADTGPLIALGRVGHLKLLGDLYHKILIPPAVRDELQLGSQRPGAQQCAQALELGWLQVRELSPGSASSLSELLLIIDLGEAEAILLAEEMDCRFLLIDENKGRVIAKRRGVPLVGVAGVLLAAKKVGLVDVVVPLVTDLQRVGYRMSLVLTKQIARLAGEDC
jgi:predicted nucleic acid-binding protein